MEYGPLLLFYRNDHNEMDVYEMHDPSCWLPRLEISLPMKETILLIPPTLSILDIEGNCSCIPCSWFLSSLFVLLVHL